MDEIRHLIDMMQSSLVELFEQLRELRERLHIVTGVSSESSPSIVPLFSEIKSIRDDNDNNHTKTKPPNDAVTSSYETDSPSDLSSQSDIQHIIDESDTSNLAATSIDSSSSSARVSRVLDPVAHELRTGEAGADIILEYLQAAKDYLIDDDERKKKVGRDMDIVLNFLKARGKRGIRTEERDNILKRISRWKAHLVSYSDSPAV